MNKKMSVIKQSTNMESTKANTNTNLNQKGHIFLSKKQDDTKIEIDNTTEVKNTNLILANLSKNIMEDLKSFSNEWVEIIEKKHDDINKEIHSFLKFASEHKKKVESLKTNNDERMRKLETLKNIKSQFNLV